MVGGVGVSPETTSIGEQDVLTTFGRNRPRREDLTAYETLI